MPVEDSVLTIRVIKSFPYRITKNLVLQHVNLSTTTVAQLKDLSKEEINTKPGWKVYKHVKLDTLKLYTKAHGSKTTNLIINLDHDDWILDDGDATLASLGIENETEISFFNRDDYEAFKADPTEKWV
ncbi:hypothetical protein BCR37DRAFT_351622 [Protomyces lactucae-debilis]|uniref:Uncharacterized protein n=1 Tax=Protomyces lactucae-debilis TaxID=2754530 RepID=A0A1Y2EWV7_PROLT|nr:uncharacterized protein BCR37DRAFT_351622 [Protomyces lactucae-debilis]ORY76092.1 hypothetical protein BCR37DRAFT_351622 [Protomyces lactucae-debilis]